MSQYNEMEKKIYCSDQQDYLGYLSLHRQHLFIFSSNMSLQYTNFYVVFSQGSADTWLACMANCGLSQFY